MLAPDCLELLDECVAYHGHLCFGQALGVRLAVAGLNYLGLPVLPASERRYRDLIVIVENDRCIADAIAVVTGTRLGRKTLKLQDYGKNAATFCLLGEENSSNGVRDRAAPAVVCKAVRVCLSEKLDVCIARYAREQGLNPEEKETRIHAVLNLATEDFLCLTPVTLEFSRSDLPGKPWRKVICEVCGERVIDGKDMEKDGKIICRACAAGAYYTKLTEVESSFVRRG